MELRQVKSNLNKMVVYKGKKGVYKMVACIMRKDKSGLFYTVELLDTKHGNSVLTCGLDDVKEMDGDAV